MIWLYQEKNKKRSKSLKKKRIKAQDRKTKEKVKKKHQIHFGCNIIQRPLSQNNLLHFLSLYF